MTSIIKLKNLNFRKSWQKKEEIFLYKTNYHLAFLDLEMFLW